MLAQGNPFNVTPGGQVGCYWWCCFCDRFKVDILFGIGVVVLYSRLLVKLMFIGFHPQSWQKRLSEGAGGSTSPPGGTEK